MRPRLQNGPDLSRWFQPLLLSSSRVKSWHPIPQSFITGLTSPLACGANDKRSKMPWQVLSIPSIPLGLSSRTVPHTWLSVCGQLDCLLQTFVSSGAWWRQSHHLLWKHVKIIKCDHPCMKCEFCAEHIQCLVSVKSIIRKELFPPQGPTSFRDFMNVFIVTAEYAQSQVQALRPPSGEKTGTQSCWAICAQWYTDSCRWGWDPGSPTQCLHVCYSVLACLTKCRELHWKQSRQDSNPGMVRDAGVTDSYLTRCTPTLAPSNRFSK